MSDSRADFSVTTRQTIRQRYASRCAICLDKLGTEASQCAHLFDTAFAGKLQIQRSVELGIQKEHHPRNTAENGMVQCPTCHIGYFTPGIIALSPPSPVLQYIVTYLAATKPTERKPLWEVFALLIRAAEGHDVDLPDPHPILPYLGLYTLVTLKTEGLHPLHLRLTPCLPTLSTLENNIFVPAPPGTLPTAPNVSRIFDVLQTPEPSLDDTFGGIPISPLHPEYGQKRYWRLPIRPERVLAALWGRALNISPSVCEEIHHVQVINALLCLGTGFLETIMASGSGPSGFGGQREREEHGSDDGKERRSQNTMAVGKFFAGGGKSSDAGNNISDAPLNDEIGFEDSSTSQSPPDGDAENWEFGPNLSTNEIIFAARGIVLLS